MRVTITLDPDVAALLRAETAKSRPPFKQVLNETIRRGLSPSGDGPRVVRTWPYDFEFKPEVDPARVNQLADELEAEEIRKKLYAERGVDPETRAPAAGRGP